jgi:uncharacterized protein (TIGR02246 family)
MENISRRTEAKMEKIAIDNFSLWAESLQSKDPKRVAELYAQDNTFLPTMSPDFKQGILEAEGYFERFLQKNPKGKIVQGIVQSLGEDAYLHSGMYDFEISDDGNLRIVSARFTFAWRKDSDGKWRIVHHHSSIKPQ